MAYATGTDTQPLLPVHTDTRQGKFQYQMKKQQSSAVYFSPAHKTGYADVETNCRFSKDEEAPFLYSQNTYSQNMLAKF